MSGGATFSDADITVKPTHPLDVVATFVHVRKRAREEKWTREQVRDCLEQLGLLPYMARPGYVQGHRPDEPRKR